MPLYKFTVKTVLAFVPGLQPSYFKPSLGERKLLVSIYNRDLTFVALALNLALSKSELSKKYKPLFSSQQKPRLISCWACHSTLSQQQRTQRRRGERESFLPLYKFTVKTVLAFVPGLQPSYFKPSLGGKKTPREHIYNHGPILTVPALNSALSKSEHRVLTLRIPNIRHRRN